MEKDKVRELTEAIEALIAEKADGLCMDVPEERRKLARLIAERFSLELHT